MDRNVERTTSSVAFIAYTSSSFAAVRARAFTRLSESWAFLVSEPCSKDSQAVSLAINRGPNGLGSQHGCFLPNVAYAQLSYLRYRRRSACSGRSGLGWTAQNSLNAPARLATLEVWQSQPEAGPAIRGRAAHFYGCLQVPPDVLCAGALLGGGIERRAACGCGSRLRGLRWCGLTSAE